MEIDSARMAQETFAVNSNDIEATWAFIKEGISEIMYNTDKGLSYRRYMDLYTRGAKVIGGELYFRLEAFFNEYLTKNYRDTPSDYIPDRLLVLYIENWNQYTQGAIYVHNVFKYINRWWVRRQREEGRLEIYDVFTLALKSWIKYYLDPLKVPIVNALLIMINSQRQGQRIHDGLIKTLLGSYITLGIGEKESIKFSTKIYKEYFEEDFLQSTRVFYEAESRRCLETFSVNEYLKLVEIRINDEDIRVETYLDSSTRKPLLKICDEVLIERQAEKIRQEFLKFLEEHRIEDLSRLFKLLSRIDGGLSPLKSQFENFVTNKGKCAIEKMDYNENDTVDPKLYVEALIRVYTKYRMVVSNGFGDNAEFAKALDNACRSFFNRNKACLSNSSKSPEYFARYADAVLRRGSKLSLKTDTETLLNEIMIVFKYIEDRDVFQKFYTFLLSKRFIAGNFASEDLEAIMISKLREVCGYEYTNKLQRMVQDVAVSKDLNKAFQTYSKEKGFDSQMEFSVLVLAHSFWPLTALNSTFAIPKPIESIYTQFCSFFAGRHLGRKLNWFFHESKAELQASYAKEAPKVGYCFQVSTFQMAVLLQFNTNDIISQHDLEKEVGLDNSLLESTLSPLLKSKILIQSKKSDEILYELNFNFKSKHIKVNLNQPLKINSKKENEETLRSVGEDRKMVFQSTIVRIMKTKRKLRHVKLVQETIDQLKSQFNPIISDIKKTIEILIEKDYIEKKIEGNDVEYSYIA